MLKYPWENDPSLLGSCKLCIRIFFLLFACVHLVRRNLGKVSPHGLRDQPVTWLHTIINLNFQPLCTFIVCSSYNESGYKYRLFGGRNVHVLNACTTHMQNNNAYFRERFNGNILIADWKTHFITESNSKTLSAYLAFAHLMKLVIKV